MFIIKLKMVRLYIFHCVRSVRIRSYSVRMRENAEQNNSEYGHFSRSFQVFIVTILMVLKKESIHFKIDE